jgi:hypothetical protein
MKYMLLFCGTVAEDEQWRKMLADVLEQEYGKAAKWFETFGHAVESGCELQAVTTATTVRKAKDGKPFVTDGPFAESGEVVGGYCIINAADLDEVLAMAKQWPGGAVEIRPVVER